MTRQRCPTCGGWHEPGLHERGNPFRIESSEPIGYSVYGRRPRRVGGDARFQLEDEAPTDRLQRAVRAVEREGDDRRQVRRSAWKTWTVVLLSSAAGLTAGWLVTDGEGPRALLEFSAPLVESLRPESSVTEAGEATRPGVGSQVPIGSTTRLESARSGGTLERTEATAEPASMEQGSDDVSANQQPRVTVEVFGRPPSGDSASAGRAPNR